MPLPLDEFYTRLALMADASLLCDVLDISSEDIIERFWDVIEDRIEVLRDTFDIDFELEEYEDDE
jgi:hypothetical protein